MRVLFAAFVGGIALFVWGFVSWTVLDWHRASGGVLPGETAVVETLRSTNTRTGVYTVPGIDHKADVSDAEKEKAEEDWERKHRGGPLAFIAYRTDGFEPMAPIVFARGYALGFAGSLIVALMLAAAGLASWFGRFLFVVGFGLFAAVGEGYFWNYFAFPDDWTIVMAADHLAGWAIAGFFIASIVKPKAASA